MGILTFGLAFWRGNARYTTYDGEREEASLKIKLGQCEDNPGKKRSFLVPKEYDEENDILSFYRTGLIPNADLYLHVYQSSGPDDCRDLLK